jgi:hypothetical protein
MAYTTRAKGSWWEVDAGNPAEAAAAAGLPGSWPWFPQPLTTLVRADQVAGLPAKSTGATAGAPGAFTPAGSLTPANLAALVGVVAAPATAWATGDYVVTADAAHNHWAGAAWAAGDAP